MTLDCGRLGGHTDHSYRAQWTFPHNLPRMSSFLEPDFPSTPVRALGHRIPMQRESTRLDVHVPRTIVGVPGMVEGAQFRLVRPERLQHIRFEHILGQLTLTVRPPNITVLIRQKVMPVIAHGHAVEDVGQVQVSKYYFQD